MIQILCIHFFLFLTMAIVEDVKTPRMYFRIKILKGTKIFSLEDSARTGHLTDTRTNKFIMKSRDVA